MKQMSRAAQQMAATQKLFSDVKKYQDTKKLALQDSAALQQQKQTATNLSAQYQQEKAAVDALVFALDRLKRARADNQAIQSAQQAALKDLKQNEVTLKAQFKTFKGNPDQYAALRAQMEQNKAAQDAQKAAIAALRAEYKTLGEQAKQTSKDLLAANKSLQGTTDRLKVAERKFGDLKETLTGRITQARGLRDSLLARGFNPAQMNSSLAALKQRVFAENTRADYLLARAGADSKLATAKRDILQQQARQDVLNVAAQIKAQALSALNANAIGIEKAQYQLQLRNARGLSNVKPVAPSTNALTQATKLNAAVSGGKYFGAGVEKLNQVLNLAAAYQNLSREYRGNHQLYQRISADTRALEKQHQLYANSISNLRGELTKYQNAFNINKANLAPADAQKAAEKIKSITAEIANAEKILAQLGKNIDASRGNKQNITASLQAQMQQLRQLRDALKGQGFSTSNFAASEASLRAQIEATNKALERQRELQSLLDRYSAGRKASQPEIAARQKEIAAAQKVDNKISMQRTLQNLRALSEQIKARESALQQTLASVSLNANATPLNRAWANLGRLNNFNANPPAVEKVKPQVTVLKEIQKLNASIDKRGFGEGLKGLQNILTAANAYTHLKEEMLSNRNAHRAMHSEFLRAQRNYKLQQNAVRALQTELTKYRSAYEANKKNLSAADATAAVANIKAMAAELSAAQKILTQLERQLKAIGANRQGVGAGIQAQIQALRTLQGLLNSAGFSTQNFVASESALLGRIDATTRAMERQAALVERLNNAQNNFNDAQTNYQAAKNFAQTILSPFTGSVQYAAEFEKEMSAVKALTQMDNIRAGNLERVNEEMEKLTLRAKLEGLRTQFTAADAARGEKYLAYSGWTQEQIDFALPRMLDIATASGLSDLGRVAEMTSDIMMAFQLKPNEAQRAVDVLTYTFTHSNQNLEQLYETMKYAAPISVGFGSSFEETAAITKFMADSGVKGSMAGTAMRALMTRLVAPPKTITKTLQENGLTLDDANKAWIAANEVMEKELGTRLDENLTAGQQMAAVIRQINTNLKDRTNQEKMAVFKSITGLYGLSGGMNLFKHGGEMVTDPVTGEQITAIELFTRQLEESQGAAQQTADVMRDNYTGAITALESAWQNLKIEFGKAITPTLRAVAEFVTPLVRGFILFANEHPRIVQAAAAIAASLAAIAVSATGAALAFAAFDLAGAQIALFRAGMAGAEIATAGFAARLGMLARAFKGLAIWGTLAPLLKFGGWAKIGAGIKGAFTGARALGVAGIASMLGGKIVGAAKGAAAAIRTIATAFRVATVAGLSFAFSPICLALAALALTAYAVYKNWDSLKYVFDSLSDTISAQVSPAFEAARTALEDAGESINTLFKILTGGEGITDTFAEGFVIAVKVISEAFAALVQFIAYSVATLASLIGGLAETFDKFYEGDYRGARVAASLMLDNTIENAKNAIVEPAKTIAGIPEGARKAQEYFRLEREAQKDRVKNPNLNITVDRQLGVVTRIPKEFSAPKEAAVRRHALQYNPATQAYGSGRITQEKIVQQAEHIKELHAISEKYFPTLEKVQSHRQDATPRQIESQTKQIKAEMELDAEEAPPRQLRNERAATWQKAQQDYNQSRGFFTPQLQMVQPQNQQASLPSFDFVATPQSVNLNTEQAQAQISALGAAAQTNALNLQVTDFATQIFQTALHGTSAASQQLSTNLTGNNSAVMQNSVALNITNAALAQNSSSVLQNSAAMQNSVGSINSMAGAANNSTGNIASLSSASAGAAGSISGLGAAAQSAISSLLSAGASAAGRIGAAVGNAVARLNIGQNAKGGIYNHGAFLTWFAEKSPEAAIPLDGSERAINLWQTAGQLLGVYPAENYNGGIYKNGGQSIAIQKAEGNNGNFDLTFHIDNLDALSKSVKNFAQVANNIVSPPFENRPSPLENLPERVRKSKSYEVLTGRNSIERSNAPQAITAPQQWSPKGLLQKILSGNITGALETAGDMYRRRKEIERGGKQTPVQPLPYLNVQSPPAETETQEKQKRRQTQKTILNTVLGIGGLFGLSKIFKNSGEREQSKIIGGLSTILAPAFEKIFGGGRQEKQKLPIPMTREGGNYWGQNTAPPFFEEMMTPRSVRAQRVMQGQLEAGRANLPERVRKSKSYEVLTGRNSIERSNAPQAITAPQQWSPKGLLQKILSGNITGALETAGQMYGRRKEIESWGKVSPQIQAPDPFLNAQSERLQAINTPNETFNRIEQPAQNNSTPAEMPSISLNFTINIQGNANAQDVEKGVKQAVPFIQESFENQFRNYFHEKQRRVFL